jgi:hypothetical protein
MSIDVVSRVPSRHVQKIILILLSERGPACSDGKRLVEPQDCVSTYYFTSTVLVFGLVSCRRACATGTPLSHTPPPPPPPAPPRRRRPPRRASASVSASADASRATAVSRAAAAAASSSAASAAAVCIPANRRAPMGAPPEGNANHSARSPHDGGRVEQVVRGHRRGGFGRAGHDRKRR